MIYLDYNSTTPVIPEIREQVTHYLSKDWGNPSSTYHFGAKLKSKIEIAREQVGVLVGSKYPREILFTSGGSESNNSAIHAAIVSNLDKKHIVTTRVEHSSVLSYLRYLEKFYHYRVTYLPVSREGLIALSDLEAAASQDTVLVSIMWANNESGVIFPVADITKICKSKKILYHCDATQAVGKVPIDVTSLNIDYLSITGHKLYAPKGIGALYVNKQAPFDAFIHGGHQEHSRRGGTENLPFIIGMGLAAEHAQKNLSTYAATVKPLRDKLEQGILETIDKTELNGHIDQRLANTSNITFHGIESEALLLLLDQAGICASSGSACLADSPDPSHVVAAMKSSEEAGQCIRFSLSPNETPEQIDTALAAIKSACAVLR